MESQRSRFSNSMFDHMEVATFHKLREEGGLVYPKIKIGGYDKKRSRSERERAS